MLKIKISKIISFTILLIAILSIQPYTTYPIGNTFIWWSVQIFILIIFWYSKSIYSDPSNNNFLRVVLYYLIWNIFCILHGFFIAENYWDWKGLIGNTMALLLPIIVYTLSNIDKLKEILKFYIKYTLPLFTFFAFFIFKNAYGFFLMPVIFLISFIPVLTTRWKVIILILATIVLTGNLGARSNIIKFGISLVFLSFYYIKYLRRNKVMELLRNLFIIAPLIFFVLAISGIFNVFDMDRYIKGDYKEAKKNENGEIVYENLKADTRSFLYVDVLNTAKEYNSWLIGRSPARGNKSETFGDEDMTGRGERLSNEVGILNVFSWTGIIGVILYFLVFYRASYMAVNKSNNIFIQMIGLNVAFRWLYSWIEDINNFSLNYFMLWLMIGICFSKTFREMTNEEVKIWARGIFDNRYQRKIVMR